MIDASNVKCPFSINLCQLLICIQNVQRVMIPVNVFEHALMEMFLRVIFNVMQANQPIHAVVRWNVWRPLF